MEQATLRQTIELLTARADFMSANGGNNEVINGIHIAIAIVKEMGK